MPGSQRAARVLLAAVLFGAGACHEGTIGPPQPISVTIRPARQWSGGQISITAPPFQERQIPAMVTVGVDTLGNWWEDDTTLAANLPQLPSGDYDVTLTLLDGRHGTAPVQVTGLAGAYMADHLIMGGVLPWSLHSVVGFSDEANGPVLIDVRTGDVQTFTGLTRRTLAQPTLVSPGVSFVGGRVVLDIEGHEPHASWLLEPTPVRIGDVGCAPPYAMWYEVAEIASGKCLVVTRDLRADAPYSYSGFISTETDSATVTPLSTIPFWSPETPISFRISPDGSRVVPIGFTVPRWAVPGFRTWPVLDTTPSVVFTIDAVVVSGAAFSSDGDTLYVVVADTLDETDTYTNWRLRALDARDGSAIAHAPVDDARAVMDLAVDPVLPWLHAIVQLDGAFALRVFDRGDFSQVASVEGGTGCCERGAIVWGGSEGRLYYLSLGLDPAAPWAGVIVDVLAFDLLPP